MFKYETIAEYITKSIKEGVIDSGTKLPSLRFMSKKFQCAVSVIMQAYNEMERQGIIYSVEKSGYYAAIPSNTPQPTSNREVYSLKKEVAKPLSIIGNIVEASNDKSIAPLGAGIPAESLLPLNGLKQSISRTVKENPGILQAYTDEAGDLQLRIEICKIMLNRKISVKPEEILITNGCIEALALSIQAVTHPGDTIAVEAPFFIGTLQLLKELKRNIIMIPTSPITGMNLDALEKTLELEDVQAVILTAAFQNPLGFVMPIESRKKITVLSKKYNIPIIEDDLYSDCSHNSIVEHPIKSFDLEDNVLYCSSFSKTISPGIRIGWLIGGKYHNRCKNLKISGTLGGSALLQSSLADFLIRNPYEKHVKKLQKNIARQAAEMKTLLEKYLPIGSAISSPKGGLFIWIELDECIDALEIYRQCLKMRISIVPGQAFSNGERFKNCLRVSYGTPITEDISQAVKELGEIINNVISQNRFDSVGSKS